MLPAVGVNTNFICAAEGNKHRLQTYVNGVNVFYGPATTNVNNPDPFGSFTINMDGFLFPMPLLTRASMHPDMQWWI